MVGLILNMMNAGAAEYLSSQVSISSLDEPTIDLVEDGDTEGFFSPPVATFHR